MTSKPALHQVSHVAVSPAIVQSTLAELQRFGRAGNEGLVLWLGGVEGATARVERLLVPPQESIQSEDGVGYFVTSQTLVALNRFLNETKLRLLAQVHSHPGEAYHSPTDDAYAIVTAEGGLSLVVPDFGLAPADVRAWAVHRLRDGVWEFLEEDEVESLFQLGRRSPGQ